MKIGASVKSSQGSFQVMLQTDDHQHTITIPPKSDGFGSSVNGGEALSLALATCYCNDIYREARKRGIQVEGVEVRVDSDFEGEGAVARNIVYRARVTARASEGEIRDLMNFTDTVSEIQNTLRAGFPLILKDVEVVSRQ